MAYGNYAPFYRPGFFSPYQMQNTVPMDSQNQFGNPYMAQQQMPPQNTTSPQQNNDIIWVQGEAGAKAYLVAPNATVTLWDSENPTIYVKSADMNGVPSMRVLDFKERTAQTSKTSEESHVCHCGDRFAKKEDLAILQNRIDEMQKKIYEFENQKKVEE